MSKTLGQKRVGANFNPSQNELIDQFKNKSAELIDLLQSCRAATGQEGNRQISMAQTDFENGCMHAVKSLFAED